MHLGLFGLSGSGKTTLTNLIRENDLGYSITSASKLIKDFGGIIGYEQLSGDDIKSNQNKLILAYDLYKAEHPRTLIELHNLVETESGVELIESSVISALDLDFAFFLYTPANVIAERRLAHSERKRRLASIPDLEKLQDLALHSLQNDFQGSVIALDEGNAIMDILKITSSALN